MDLYITESVLFTHFLSISQKSIWTCLHHRQGYLHTFCLSHGRVAGPVYHRVSIIQTLSVYLMEELMDLYITESVLFTHFLSIPRKGSCTCIYQSYRYLHTFCLSHGRWLDLYITESVLFRHFLSIPRKSSWTCIYIRVIVIYTLSVYLTEEQLDLYISELSLFTHFLSIPRKSSWTCIYQSYRYLHTFCLSHGRIARPAYTTDSVMYTLSVYPTEEKLDLPTPEVESHQRFKHKIWFNRYHTDPSNQTADGLLKWRNKNQFG